MSKAEELTLDSNAFNSLKLDFKRALNKLLTDMLEKEIDEADLNIKISITLEEGAAPDLEITAYDAERDVTHAIFKHKVSSTLKLKGEELTGKVGGPDYYISSLEKKGVYALVNVNSPQQSLFDSDEGTGEIAAEDEPEAPDTGEPE